MKSKNKEANLGDLIYSITRRDPSKRQIRPVNMDNILLDDLEDESDDEYVYDGNDGDEGSDESSSGSENNENSNDDDDTSDSSESNDSDCQLQEHSDEKFKISTSKGSGPRTLVSEAYPLNDLREDCHIKDEKRLPVSASLSGRICMLCLGDQSNLNDEIIECDACKIVVHEDCHKVYNDVFLSSSASSSDTDPWFCEPCLAGVEDPHCELCPNLGGVYKRTDNNRWVHLLCALYTPGVAFNYSENLSEITLTELPSKDWSSKECSLCEDKFFAWTGVCISCDAGLCKNYFHVTCAQKAGLLAEPAYDDNPSDPYFAQCRQHTDKQVAKARRRNYLTAMNRCRVLRQTPKPEKKDVFSIDALEEFGGSAPDAGSKFSLLEDRLQRKLEYFRSHYNIMLCKRDTPYTRPTKAPLFLENSPVAMRQFMAKAIALSLPLDLTGSSAVTEASKSSAPGCPVFCPDFISYVLDRERKLEELSKRLTTLESMQRELQLSDANVSHNYNSLSTRLGELNSRLNSNRATAKTYVENLMNIFDGLNASGDLSALLVAPEASTDHSQAAPEVAAGVKRVNSAAAAAAVTTLAVATGEESTPAGADRKRSRRSQPATSGSNKAASKRRRKTMPRAGETIVIDSTPPGAIGNVAVVPVAPSAPPENIFHECSICNGYRDQHLLTICETCKRAFHIACLDPPLARVPKRSRLFAWQCSACTKAIAVIGDVIAVDVNAPRQLRRPGVSIAQPSLETSSSTAVIAAATTTPITQATAAKRAAGRRSSPGASIATARPKRGRGSTRGRPRRVVAEAYPPSMDVEAMEDLQSLATVSSVDVSGVVRTHLKVEGGDEEFLALDENVDDEEEEAEFTDGEEDGSSSGSDDDDDENDGTSDSETSDIVEEKRGVVVEETMTPEHAEAVAVKVKRSSSPELNPKEGMTSDEELATLRGSKVKFVRIKDHASPEASHGEASTKCYVICRDPSNATPEKSPAGSHIKMKIKKID